MQKNSRIFDCTETEKFYAFLEEMHKTPVAEHARQEAENLNETFRHASHVMIKAIPENRSDIRSAISPEGLSRIYQRTAQAHASMMFNGIITLSDSFRQHLEAQIPSVRTSIRLRWSQPETEGKKNRMFGGGSFGFLSAKAEVGADGEEQTLVLPYVTFPDEFIRITRQEGFENLLYENAAMNRGINHDWFHSSLMDTVSGGDIMQIPWNAPVKAFPQSQLYKHVYKIDRPYHKDFPDGADYRTLKAFDRNYEGWAMRFQCEVLGSTIAESGNSLSRSVNSYLDAWKEFSERAACVSPMPGSRFTASEYGLKILASNLFRVPPNLFQQGGLLEGAVLEEKPREYLKSIFNRLSANTYARYLFGAGTCDTSQEYTDLVLRVSGHALMLAGQDADAAIVHYERQGGLEKLILERSLGPDMSPLEYG